MSTYATDIPVRFRDIDALGHVNNAVYATYLEQARAEYYRDVFDADLSKVSSVLASLTIDFRRPVELSDERVTVELDVADVGRTSVTMTHEFRVDDAVVAEGEATLVTLDPETGKPAPLPTEYREAITSYHDL